MMKSNYNLPNEFMQFCDVEKELERLSLKLIVPPCLSTFIVCTNFIHEWRDQQFKVDSE